MRSALVVVAFCLVVTPVWADDLAQIDKANKIASEANDKWLPLGAYEKAEGLLVEAEKTVASVDEIGKTPVTLKIKDVRDKIAQGKTSFDQGSVKSALEREISTAESYGDRGAADGLEEHLKKVETALQDGWLKAHLDAANADELTKKIAWARKKFASQAMSEAHRRLTGQLGRVVDELKYAADNRMADRFAERSKELDELLANADNQKVLGDELASYKKQQDEMRALFKKNDLDYWFRELDKDTKWIQDVLDGKEKAYRENVEQKFKLVDDELAKVAADDPRTKPMKDKVAQQRKTWEAQKVQGDRDEVVKPAVDYWKYCNDQYGNRVAGWEQETTPNDLKGFHGRGGLGCEKTLAYLHEVVQRFLEDDRAKKAFASYPNDPDVKKIKETTDKALETAAGKVVSFASKIVDEGEKLPAGKEREEFRQSFYNLKNTIEHATKGYPAGAALIERIDAIAKRFEQEKGAAEDAKKAQDKKCIDDANAAWPGLTKAWSGSVKKLDAPAAVANIGAWNGSVIHFSGGARGVDLNRSGWNWQSDYFFIVECDGIPVCGNLDAGMEEQIKAKEKETGIERDEVEEVYGVIDGLCKAHSRYQNPFNRNQYLTGDPVDAVRFRVVAVKMVTVAVASGGGGSSAYKWVHRFTAWGMSGILVLAGLLATAWGAARWVKEIQEQKVKAGDWLAYGGIALAVIGVIWFGAAVVLYFVGLCEIGSLPSAALVLGGGILVVDLLRSKGHVSEENASMIQPVGIVLGLGCFLAALVHFFFWDYPLL